MRSPLAVTVGALFLFCAPHLFAQQSSPAAESGTKNEPATKKDSTEVQQVRNVPLSQIKSLYVAQMPNDLDQYIRAEVTKQFQGKMAVTLKKEDADAMLAGTSDLKKGTGAAITGRWLGLHDNATGSVSLVAKDDNTILWSSEAGDRSLWWGALARGGQRKVASRLVHNLKAAMEHSK